MQWYRYFNTSTYFYWKLCLSSTVYMQGTSTERKMFEVRETVRSKEEIVLFIVAAHSLWLQHCCLISYVIEILCLLLRLFTYVIEILFRLCWPHVTCIIKHRCQNWRKLKTKGIFNPQSYVRQLKWKCSGVHEWCV